jgi:hypothetical protein
MPLYTEPAEPEFARLEARHGWFPRVLLAEYGEIDPPSEIPEALNWLLLLPAARRYDFEDVECGLAYVAPDGGYACTVWDVSGEEDDPWAVFVVDEQGARLLPEYSIFAEEATEAERAERLRRAADELPDRLEAGEFRRGGAAIVIPAWLAGKGD